ncbi:DUF3891 family protein [Rossellomorea aquimaris]|uniref:DUF3891 family protein n=1 Tax=Rossellomorea aquimaris TaxID=189382 RepID=UPI001CD4E84A|nr:DUF3891 family protein [Rossellomorea aquimaris]MCA1054415.1 DUF3891 family protein [Rossellomorea aquimaris]
MIIRETNDSFIMIRQHDHAFLSGEIIKHFDHSLLPSSTHFNDLVYAAYQHDRSWIGLDDTPVWDDANNTPYTFADYPLLPKMAFYRIGLDEIERENPYAALLCSLHFHSFFTKSKKEECLSFMKEERMRQSRLRSALPETDEELLQQHFRLLQFSDDLSLYICLNEPGARKEEEHPWFKDGFKNTEWFNRGQGPLQAEWGGTNTIKIDAFPFTRECRLTLTYKKVPKESIDEKGIAQAFEECDWLTETFTLQD